MKNAIIRLSLVTVAFLFMAKSDLLAQTIDRLPGGAPKSFEVKSFKGSNMETIDYSLLVPKIPQVGNKLPLVLCLHGSGGNTKAAQVLGSLELQEKYPCFVMAPACAKDKLWTTSGVSKEYLEGRPGYTENGIRSVESELIEALDYVLANYPVDPDRIYITGQSKGGSGTWGLILAHPDRFAAAAPVCGRSDPSLASRISTLPIWVFHGGRDTVVPVTHSREMIEALRKSGGTPGYTEFPGVGHNSWTPAYQMDVFWDWLFKQSLSHSEK